MATWERVSAENLKAAKALLEEGLFRSCASRAYYAVYAAATARLSDRGVQFPYGGNNPTHEQLPGLILHNLPEPEHTRRRLAAAVRRLRLGRVEADYVPQAAFDRSLARDLVRDASTVLELLEVEDGNDD